MAVINDPEFGDITVRRSARATQVRIRVAPDGTLRASMPLYAPIFLLKRLIKSSRDELHQMIQQAQPVGAYTDGQQIGKSHTLIVQHATTFKLRKEKQRIIVQLPINKTLSSPDVVRAIRDVSASALRLEAKSYLPKRLAYLANKHGFEYERVRFSHASSRWGSCSSTGTISLNIALMKLPFELIDYVLIHELAHTRQMNHSSHFWDIVQAADPNFKDHRRALKKETPSI